MSKQRKTALILVFSIIVSAFSFINASALQVGDEIGDVLNTNIKTYINGERIPSYNIKNKSAVLIKDLVNYGFDGFFNVQDRTTTVTFNPDKKFTPLTNFDETTGKAGTVAFRYVYSDIVVYVNGKQVDSFNIKGNSAIFFNDLRDYGTFVWDSMEKESRLTLNKIVKEITLNKTSAAMRTGESFTLTAAVTPSNASNKTLTWTSSNPKIARVSDKGYVTGISAGTTAITATSSTGVAVSCTVTVQSAGVLAVRIVLDKTTATVKVNEWISLKATAMPANTTDKTVTWASSNLGIARVDENGYVMGISQGTATIMAMTSNGLTASCTVTVQPATFEITEISLDRTSAAMRTGESFKLTPMITPANAADKRLTWASSNPNIANVSDNGCITAISAGTTVITVTSSNGLTASCIVTVSANIVPMGIMLDTKTSILEINEWLVLTPTISPADTTDKTIIWTSSNSNVAWVQDGCVIGVSTGTATITAWTANGQYYDTCIVWVW